MIFFQKLQELLYMLHLPPCCPPHSSVCMSQCLAYISQIGSSHINPLIHGPMRPNWYMFGWFLSQVLLSSPAVDLLMASMSRMLRFPMMEEENGQPVSTFTYLMTLWLRDVMSSCTQAMAWGRNVSVLSCRTFMLLRYE